jgi:uncharacterized pyridoxal phosphate-containing UPF0001 family protein
MAVLVAVSESEESALASRVRDRLAEVRHVIEGAGGHPDRVRIVAVTKGFGVDAVTAATEVGLTDVGENYAQELLIKAAALAAGASRAGSGGQQQSPAGSGGQQQSPAGSGGHQQSPAGPEGRQVRWHFLGPLQRNKAARLAPHVYLWHALDRPAAADAIAAHAPAAAVLIQVNITRDPRRPGCLAEDVPALVEHARNRGLDLRGLMGVGPADDRDGSRRGFQELARLASRLHLPELSMGMSDDFDIAVAEGATILRLGRVLFGPRPGGGNVGR